MIQTIRQTIETARNTIKPRIHERAKWFANHWRMVHKRNACMCGWNFEPALYHLRTVCIPFFANQNLSVFCANTKRTGCVGCPFYAPGVLCSPQVCRKLINHMPNTRRMRMTQLVSGTLVYTKFQDSKIGIPNCDADCLDTQKDSVNSQSNKLVYQAGILASAMV